MRPGLVAICLVGLACLGCPTVAEPDDRRRPPGEGEGEGEEQVFGDGVAGDECSFNADCGEGLRCGCDGLCACEAGARGTGRLNDACATGNDCASSVCVEGPPASPSFLCSEACVDDDDCGGDLPLCSDVAFVGRICIRTPPP